MLHFNEVVIVTCPFQKNLIRGPESLTLHQYYINIVCFIVIDYNNELAAINNEHVYGLVVSVLVPF